MMRKQKWLILLCLAATLLWACISPKMGDKESMPAKVTNLQEFRKAIQGRLTPQETALLEKTAQYETRIPGATMDLEQTYRALGNPESQKVIVYAQGGPATELHSLGIALFIEKAGLDLQQYLLLQVKQQNMIDAQRLFEEPIDFEQAKRYARKNTELLRNVVVFLQGQGRQVSLMGISLGSYIIANYLADYGNDVYRIVFNTGRLDTPKKAVELASKGNIIMYSKDGKDVSIREMPFLPETIVGNFSRIAGAHGFKSFTRELADIDLSNAIYVYAVNDQNIGKMSKAELAFLKERNIYQVYSSDKAHGGAPHEYAPQTAAFMLGLE